MRLFSSIQRSASSMPVVIIRILLLVVALVFVIVGIFRGEAAVVLQKAANICFECIGL